ncbi:MAG: hypothetical protein WA021_00790 [Minisyncoccia bacterium]
MNQSPISSGSQMPPQPMEPQKSSIGPIAGAIIVILLLAAGGLYYWGAKLNENVRNNTIPYIPDDGSTMQMQENGAITEAEGDASVGLPTQSSSDDAAAIESDFNAMNMNQIDASNEAEMNNI